MNLSEQELSILHERAAAGAQLNDIQKIIQGEFGKNITYMETRFLVSDHSIQILSPEEQAEEKSEPEGAALQTTEEAQPFTSGVSLTVDAITRPGLYKSGSVVWSDGVTSGWYLDETGRLGLESSDTTYQPVPSDIEEFQLLLRNELEAGA